MRIREKLYLTQRKEDLDQLKASITNTPDLGKASTHRDMEIMNRIQASTGADLVAVDQSTVLYRPMPIVQLGLAHNQLGPMSGYALSSLLKRNPSLTSLDISDNALGHVAGEAITDALERTLTIASKDYVKVELEKIEQANYESRSGPFRSASPTGRLFTSGSNSPTKSRGSSRFEDKRAVSPMSLKQSLQLKQQHAVEAVVAARLTSCLIHLNVARNNLGPKCCNALLSIMSVPNATLTSLDLSCNPLGHSEHKVG